MLKKIIFNVLKKKKKGGSSWCVDSLLKPYTLYCFILDQKIPEQHLWYYEDIC